MPKVFKLKQPTVIAESNIIPVPRKVLKLKKKIPIPPPPAAGAYMTKATEAFEAIRDYCRINSIAISEADIKWYHEELALEKKEMDEFWERCSVTKAAFDAFARGEDINGIILAEAKAKLTEKKEPLRESDIGEMPAYGTREFWAWCMKRKQLRLQKEAAIIAAGGTIPAKKVKVKAKKN
jgi:hypothetical protein